MHGIFVRSDMNKPHTIQIFLPTGDPRGFRVAEITSRTIRALQVSRSQLELLRRRGEITQPACYFLFGEAENSSTVYIGQSEDLNHRLSTHDAQKVFWNQAIVVVSNNNTFTQTHIRYLEWLAICRAKTAGRYVLDNANSSSEPHVTESVHADISDAFETISVLLSTLGFPVFEPVAATLAADSGLELESKPPLFRCDLPSMGVSATGEWAPEGFILHKGSTVRGDVVSSAEADVRFMKKRQRLIDEGKFQKLPDGNYVTTENVTLTSPSLAATLVKGRSTNGWQLWITDDGRTLDSIYRSAPPLTSQA